jgi:phosphatidylcholine synthase
MKPAAAAGLVHAYTASGLVLAAVAAVLIVRGDPDALRAAFLCFLLATAVDASDGVLARRFDVARHVPSIDGRRLDDIIDFQTYTSLPLLLIWRAGLLPGALGWLLLVPLLASAFGFTRVQAKLEDHYFLGFPSYWNVVAFYLYFLGPPPAITALVLLALAGLTILPTRYLYPSMGGALNRAAALGGAAWGVLLALILTGAVPERPWVIVSLVFPAFYMIASWSLPGGARRTGGSRAGGQVD